MSSTTSAEAVIDDFIAAIRPDFDYVLAVAAFSACLFTLLIVLFAFSTKESRRRLVFRLNVLAICITMTLGILVGVVCGKAVVDPFNPVSKGVYVASVVFAIFPPVLYDSILLTRLFALYPISTTPPATLLKMFTFPFCVKCARVIVVAINLNGYVSAELTTLTLEEDASTSWFRNSKMIAEWAMQIADNLYSVSIFLYNLHVRTSSVKRAGGIAERIRQIFYISLANFVFPFVFNIALIICVTTDRSPTNGVLLIIINNYITVIGVLCATLWFSGSEWVRTRNEPLCDYMINSPKLNSGRDRVTGGKSGSEVVVIGRGSVAVGMSGSGSELAVGLHTPEKENTLHVGELGIPDVTVPDSELESKWSGMNSADHATTGSSGIKHLASPQT
ncbi:hypothetical protein EDC04DRAFT_2605252 [Pisolithus marmoratus]|nr:hypothetical protein EDC04DRAFT_2605252 [Pisolithus marmoratus]